MGSRGSEIGLARVDASAVEEVPCDRPEEDREARTQSKRQKWMRNTRRPHGRERERHRETSTRQSQEKDARPKMDEPGEASDDLWKERQPTRHRDCPRANGAKEMLTGEKVPLTNDPYGSSPSNEPTDAVRKPSREKRAKGTNEPSQDGTVEISQRSDHGRRGNRQYEIRRQETDCGDPRPVAVRFEPGRRALPRERIVKSTSPDQERDREEYRQDNEDKEKSHTADSGGEE